MKQATVRRESPSLRLFRCLIATSLLLSLSLPAKAETYRGIGPYYTLNDVKAIFPQATVSLEKPAWAQPHQSFAFISGGGIDGTIVICFADYRQFDRLDKAQRSAKSLLGINYAADTNNALVVEWVRYSPEYLIPVDAVKSTYGKNYKRLNRKDNFKPYLYWESRQVEATLSNDGKFVLSLDFGFTSEEYFRRRVYLHNNPRPATYIPTPAGKVDDDPEESPEVEEEHPSDPPEHHDKGQVSVQYVFFNNKWCKAKCEWNGDMWVPFEEVYW